MKVQQSYVAIYCLSVNETQGKTVSEVFLLYL